MDKYCPRCDKIKRLLNLVKMLEDMMGYNPIVKFVCQNIIKKKVTIPQSVKESTIEVIKKRLTNYQENIIGRIEKLV